MELVTRSWSTAAVALTVASVIAAAPVAGPPPGLSDLETRAVQLTAGFDPLTTWQDVFQTASGNAMDIFNHFWAAPFPALQEELVNRVGYIGDVISNPADTGKVLEEFLDGLSTASAAHFAPFVPVGGATDTLYSSLDIGHQDYFEVVQQFANSALVGFSASPMSGILWGDIGTTLSPTLQYGADITGIVDALSGADLTTAFQELVDMPANILGASLNGFGPVDLPSLLAPSVPGLDATITSVNMGGLLSPGGSLFNALGLSADATVGGTASSDFIAGEPVGAIGSLVALEQAIAVSLGWDGVGNPIADLAFPTLGGDLFGGMAGGGLPFDLFGGDILGNMTGDIPNMLLSALGL